MDRLDIYGREGSHGVKRPLPHIGGRDIAGEIVEIGAEAAGKYPGIAAGAAVVACGTAAHSQFAVAPALLAFPLPRGCSFVQAAAIPTAGFSAYNALANRARIKAGEDMLIVAGGSGVGSFGIQIARAAGCRVLTTVGSEDKIAKAEALGAEVINHYKEDVAARVRELTGGEGVHVVLDHVGAPMWRAAMDSLRPYGRFVTTGVTAGHLAQIHLGQVFVKGIEIHGVGRPDDYQIRGIMQGLLALVDKGLVKPVVHAEVPLAQIADAHRMMEASTFFGKIVITMPQ